MTLVRLSTLLLAAAFTPLFGSTFFSSAPLERIESIGGLPAHVAGRFAELTACEQSPEGEYFVFDRRAHGVFAVAPPYTTAREVVRIGGEPGRILQPTAFALAKDGSFVVADSPGNRGRIQVFLTSGASVGGFTLPTRDVPTMVFDSLMLSGITSLDYTGQQLVISQPELGSLISEYSMDGRASRTIGLLRTTGHEADREVHLAMNAGLPIANPQGGFYFVFIAGVPAYRKYDAQGTLLFERHIEGPELDAYIRTIPTTWRRQRTVAGELPIVQPAVLAAAADPAGNLWISIVTGVTYVYDPDGDKRRSVQFHGAGVVSPRALFFTHESKVLVSPGCYAFPATGTERS